MRQADAQREQQALRAPVACAKPRVGIAHLLQQTAEGGIHLSVHVLCGVEQPLQL